ncbi:hypothetical protein [Aurantimonas sp. 22II-16-19i]|uniref:hypothetical protein n=1 Tax=Aurantimonas sp. 22II-16-19i TaxID=1317114 RepID=UPI0009F7B3B0|nr:hypothetical protein [Aurantimonas sp. 22II-16-19i]ORE94947.1 hypothetical protein ATO4_13735 [Aurantimonas sp. 22II-16-19i]
MPIIEPSGTAAGHRPVRWRRPPPAPGRRAAAPAAWLAAFLSGFVAVAAATAAGADDADGPASGAAGAGPPPLEAGLALELNNAVDEAGVCRLSYVAVNRTGEALETVSYDVVVFDRNDRVSRFLVLQFGRLPEGKTKVVQFDLADQPCADISRILVNEVAECGTANGEVGNGASGGAAICMEALRPASRTAIVFDT